MKIILNQFKGYRRPPVRAYDNDAGADVFNNRTKVLQAHETVRIPLGFGLELPDGFAAYIMPRSSLAEDGIVCQVPPIDSGYRGEISAIVSNLNDYPVPLAAGARIGQIVIMPVIYAEFVDQIEDKRSTKAFGSTGA